MKVLFVCRSNTGRSQVAEEIYNRLTNSKDAESAGTIVDAPKTVVEKKPASGVIEAMDELGYDIRNNLRTQITEDMINNFDKVIVMAEPENIPDWLSQSENYEYWEVEDIKGKTKEESLEIIEIITKKLQNFLIRAE